MYMSIRTPLCQHIPSPDRQRNDLGRTKIHERQKQARGYERSVNPVPYARRNYMWRKESKLYGRGQQATFFSAQFDAILLVEQLH